MKTTWFTLAGALLALSQVRAAVAISGRPVPEMAIFDTRMKDYMEANSISAGVLGIMYQGRIVYLRGFGALNPGINLPENAIFRIASISKPVTAAAIRMMAVDGTFGPLGLNRKAFNLKGNGGLLNITPWPDVSNSDPDLTQVTIGHLVQQTGGFGDPDCVFRDGSRQVSTDMGIAGPPDREQRIRWMMGKPQQHAIGTYNYSNFNSMVLGEIMERYGGGYVQYIRSRILTAAAWVPASEVHHGATLLPGRLPREAPYGGSELGQNVFDYSPPIDNVPLPYGGYFDMDGLLGAGSIAASAPAMLQFASRFRLVHPNSGVPYDGSGDGIHDGGLSGLSSRLSARGGGVMVFVVVNNDGAVGGAYDQISPLLDAGPGPTTFTWPSTTSDGHWITLPENNPAAGFGGYHSPWQGFGSSLEKSDSGSRLRLKPGTSNWTGRITKRMKLDAPLGTARLGVHP